MARAVTGDFLQGFRYHVKVVDDGYDPLTFVRDDESFNAADAGFQSVTLPEISVDAVEYREGNAAWTSKFPGIPTVSEATLMRGVVKGDTLFFDWILDVIQGNTYRVDLDVLHYRRDEDPSSSDPANVRGYKFFNCFAIRSKSAADMDATASEVALAELDIAMETTATIDPDSASSRHTAAVDYSQ